MEFTPIQKDILEWLKENPESTTPEIIKGTGYRNTTIRTNLTFLELKGETLCDKKRQPYVYSVNQNSKSIEWRNAVRAIKRSLMNPDNKAKNNIIAFIQRIPPQYWDQARTTMLQACEAIAELQLERNNIPTLETPDEQKTA